MDSGIGILLLQGSRSGIRMCLSHCWLGVFVIHSGSCSGHWRIGHVLFALIVLRCYLLGLRNGCLKHLVSHTSYWLSVIEIDPLHLLRSRMCHYVSLRRSLHLVSKSCFAFKRRGIHGSCLVSRSDWSLVSCVITQILFLVLPCIMSLMKVVSNISSF
jgi:hypothetical protein